MTRYGELLESTGRPVEAQKILGRHLQKYRKDLDLTLAPVAARLNASPAKLSRIENGESRVSDDDLHQLLTTYDVTDRRERQTLLTFNSRLARGQWWDNFPTMDSRLSSLLVLESFAPIMHTYETLFIPGLLQTPAYAAAVIGLAGESPEQARQRVEVRLRRQQILTPRGPQLWAIIGHAALRDALTDGVVSREVMREQIRHLIDVVMHQPRVVVQILPAEQRWRLEAETSFTQFRLPLQRLTEVVYLEHLGQAIFLDTEHRADGFTEAWGRMGIAAATPEMSLTMLRRCLADLDTTGLAR